MVLMMNLNCKSVTVNLAIDLHHQCHLSVEYVAEIQVPDIELPELWSESYLPLIDGVDDDV